MERMSHMVEYDHAACRVQLLVLSSKCESVLFVVLCQTALFDCSRVLPAIKISKLF
jgi:hypothetical protein